MYFLQSDSEIEDSLEPSVPKSSKKKKQSKPASKAQSPKMKVKKATDPPSDHEAESTASPSPSPKKRKKRKSVEVPVNGLDAEDGESAKRRRIDTDLSGDVSAEPTDNLPRAVIKLMKKYEKKHGDDAVKVLTTQETKDLKDKLRKNYKAFFKEHPYPRAAMLVHVAALEGKEREDAETFIADNKLYKMLGKGIPHDPITIYRTLEKCYPVRNTRREEPSTKKMTEEEESRLLDTVCEEMTGDKVPKSIPWKKVAASFPDRSLRTLNYRWRQTYCFFIDAKWRRKDRPFSADEQIRLIRGVKEQDVKTAKEIDWRALVTEFTGCKRKDLKFYWNFMGPSKKTDLQVVLAFMESKVMPRLEKRVKVARSRAGTLKAQEASLQSRIAQLNARLADVQRLLRILRADLPDEDEALVTPSSSQITPASSLNTPEASQPTPDPSQSPASEEDDD